MSSEPREAAAGAELPQQNGSHTSPSPVVGCSAPGSPENGVRPAPSNGRRKRNRQLAKEAVVPVKVASRSASFDETATTRRPGSAAVEIFYDARQEQSSWSRGSSPDGRLEVPIGLAYDPLVSARRHSTDGSVSGGSVVYNHPHLFPMPLESSPPSAAAAAAGDQHQSPSESSQTTSATREAEMDAAAAAAAAQAMPCVASDALLDEYDSPLSDLELDYEPKPWTPRKQFGLQYNFDGSEALQRRQPFAPEATAAPPLPPIQSGNVPRSPVPAPRPSNPAHLQQQQQPLPPRFPPVVGRPPMHHHSRNNSSSSIGRGGGGGNAGPDFFDPSTQPVLRRPAPIQTGPPPVGPLVRTRSNSAPTSPVAARNRPGGINPNSAPPVPMLQHGCVVQMQVMNGPDDGPDLERFLKVATPRLLRPDATQLANITLADVWRSYELTSLFGCECRTLGGPRGPSTSHFVPFLSAVQLFQPTITDADDDAEVLIYPQGLDSWPAAMRRKFSWAASEHVGERSPLYSRILELCGDQEETHQLMSTKITDLHPYSWFAVAWYPLYRIPDAPLTARFLTFHSLAPLWESASQAAAQQEKEKAEEQQHDGKDAHHPKMSYKSVLETKRAAEAAAAGQNRSPARGAPQHQQQQQRGVFTPTAMWGFPGSPLGSESGARTSATGASGSTGLHEDNSDSASVTASFGSSAPPSPAESEAGDAPDHGLLLAEGEVLELPVLGLLWHATNQKAENWTDTLVEVPLPPGYVAMPGERLANGAKVLGMYGDKIVVMKPYPVSKGGPMSWEIQLEELEDGAKKLALAHDLISGVGPDQDDGAGAGSCCPDYDFFSSRRN